MSTFVSTGCCGYGAISAPGSSSGSTAVGLTKLTEFEVGAVGAPMSDGDTEFFHPSLTTTTQILVLTNAGPLPTIAITGGRYVTLDSSLGKIVFTGGVVGGEVITIFKA